MKSPAIALLTLAAAIAPLPVEPLPAHSGREALPAGDVPDRFSALTEADYAEVAEELGISVACIKAVVEIETGTKGEGFGPDSLPLINFDLTMFKKYARLRGVNIASVQSAHPVAFAKPDLKRYRTMQAAQYARLNSAMAIDSVAAMEGTFWGMFQIGGFNWKLCGCESVEEFVKRMAYSEREQLELFAAFITARKLDKYLVKLDWAAFALRYNGPGYRKHGYDSKMAAAYRRYKGK